MKVGNRKSAFLDLASQFVGAENVFHLSLQRLEADRFSEARLFRKPANICTDLPSDRLSSSAGLKGHHRVRSHHGGGQVPGLVRIQAVFPAPAFCEQATAQQRCLASIFDRWLVITQTGSVTRGTRYRDEYSNRDYMRRTNSVAH